MQVAVQQARRRRSHLQSTHAGSFCNDVVGSEETISSQLPEGTFSPVSQSRRQETQALTWRVAIQGLLCLEWGCSASYAELMPWGLTRYHHTGQSHFVTFSCYHRRPLFTTDASRRVFEDALERVRRSFCLRVSGYVVMPEDIHLNVRNHGQFVPLFADP